MKVGWLADDPGYIGGAELTQAEFRAAAPEDMEIVDCPPGGVVDGLDRYVIHNCATYTLADLEPMAMAPVVKYVNDCWPLGSSLRLELLRRARAIFTSPLHALRFPGAMPEDWAHIPPALDLARFRAQTNGHREGNVCIGRMAYGKGIDLLADYGEPVDVYSSVPVLSQGDVTYKGALKPQDVPKTLAHYRRFVFLPTALEPFGRAVVEAWASGCEVVINRNVGARYWIEENPEGLETAADDFWRVVLDG